MKFRNLVILSIVLVAVYIAVAKSAIYVRLISKVVEWFSKGIRVLTVGSVGNE